MRAILIGTAVAVSVLLGPGIRSAEAYIDPGTGGSLFSSLGILLGAVAATSAICFSQVRRCGGWLVAKVSSRRRDKPLTPDLAADTCKRR